MAHAPSPRRGEIGRVGHRGFPCLLPIVHTARAFVVLLWNVPGGDCAGGGLSMVSQWASRDRDRHTKSPRRLRCGVEAGGGIRGAVIGGGRRCDLFERARRIGTSGGSRHGDGVTGIGADGICGGRVGPMGRGSCMGTQKEREWYVDLCRWRGRVRCVSSRHTGSVRGPRRPVPMPAAVGASRVISNDARFGGFGGGLPQLRERCSCRPRKGEREVERACWRRETWGVLQVEERVRGSVPQCAVEGRRRG